MCLVKKTKKVVKKLKMLESAKNRLKCHCVDRSESNGIKKSILFTFPLYGPPEYKIKKKSRHKH